MLIKYILAFIPICYCDNLVNVCVESVRRLSCVLIQLQLARSQKTELTTILTIILTVLLTALLICTLNG